MNPPIVRNLDELCYLLRDTRSEVGVYLGQVLVRKQLINQSQLDSALSLQGQHQGRPLGDILLDMGLVTAEQLRIALAKKLGIPYIHLEHFEVSADVLAKVPEDIAQQYNVLPLGMSDGKLLLAMENPLDHSIIGALGFTIKSNIEAVGASAREISVALHRHYSNQHHSEALQDLQLDPIAPPGGTKSLLYDAEQQAHKRPIVKLLNALILQGVMRGASDIHIRPGKEQVKVYYRIDGKLQYFTTLNKSLLPALVSRIKITAQMDIAERRLPQDGHARMSRGKRSIDLRISVIPTVTGESVVIRILDKEAGLRSLDKLGLQQRDLVGVKRLLEISNGLFLVTGPTGSGKTTTLYALLDELKRNNPHILTIEDPVEYDMEGLEQVQVYPSRGYTFAAALRHFLRHDPDVIMVGEIRDEETARTAAKAALTGHFVCSTLHTNNAAATVTRLLDMGIEAFLLGATLRGVMTQQLVRLICPHCKCIDQVSPGYRQMLGLAKQERFYRGEGCPQCGYQGYKGRTTVCELLVVTPEIAELIHSGSDASTINNVALAQGMSQLTHNTLQMARVGTTSIEEVAKVWLG